MWNYVFISLEIINIVAIVFVSLSIFLEKRPVSQILAWLAVLILLPFVGVIVFILLGRNFRKQRIFTRKELADARNIEKLSKVQSDSIEQIISENEPELAIAQGLIKLLLKNNFALLSKNNHVEVLNNGSEKFPTVYHALENANNHIHLEYYIFNEGKVGNMLKDNLIRKAKQGVKIRLIYDDFGSWGLRNDFIRELKDNDIDFQKIKKINHPFFSLTGQ